MFEREIKLIGEDKFNKILNATVCVIGIGGVGGHAIETLVRSGIKNIIIIDYDVVDITNKNRQIIATDHTIGKNKTDVMRDRILSINNDAEVITINEKIDTNNLSNIFEYNIDYFIDACDTISVKKEIIKECINRNITFISCMGTGNKLDPSKLEITDIRKTSYDPVAKILRKYVKDEKISKKVPVVCSIEVPKKSEGAISSISYVPATAGILCASYIINKIIEK